MARGSKQPTFEYEYYSRDVAGHRYSELLQKSAKRRNIVIIVLVTLISVLALLAVAGFIYLNTMSARLGDKTIITPELKEQLAPPKPTGEPFYLLLLGHDKETDGIARTDTMMLLRLDPRDEKITIVSIPRDTKIKLPGYGTQKMNAAYAFGKAPLAVETISDFAGVPIQHYMEVDFDGFMAIVDVLGGVEIDVKDRIQHENLPDLEPIEPGLQTLDTEQAMAYVRLRNYPDGDYRRMEHQRIFMSAVVNQVLEADPATSFKIIDTITHIVKTDMSLSQIFELYKQFQNAESLQIYEGFVPSYPVMIDNISYLEVKKKQWETMMDRIDSGLPPEKIEGQPDPPVSNETTSAVVKLTKKERSEYRVDVLNGSKINKAAAHTSEFVTDKGYEPGALGNANTSVDETVIVYKTDDQKDAAFDLAEVVGQGVVRKAGTRYQFDGDILLLIGSDWEKNKVEG